MVRPCLPQKPFTMPPVQNVPKLNPAGMEDNPTKDVEDLGVTLTRSMNVRFLKNLLNFGSSNCNEQQCPLVRQRLYRHIHEHHSRPTHQCSPDQQTIVPAIKMRDRAVSTMSSLTNLRAPNVLIRQSLNCRSIQTDLTSADLSRFDFIQKNHFSLNKSLSPVTPMKKKDASLKISETRSVIPDQSFYKEHLMDIGKDWLKRVRMSSTVTSEDKALQEEIIHNLVESIYKLAIDSCNTNYEEKVKSAIDICLKKLPMWSGAKSQTKFNIGLKNSLWLKIKDLNTKYLVNTDSNIDINEVINKTINRAESFKQNTNGQTENEDKIYVNTSEINVDSNIFEKEIVDWLRVNLIDVDINKLDIAGLVLKRLKPLMKDSVYDSKYKLVLKGKIFEVLADLPLNSKPDKNRVLFLNRCAEDLGNRIMSIRIKNEVMPKIFDSEQFSTVNRIESLTASIGAFKGKKLVDIIEEEISSTVMDSESFEYSDGRNNHNDVTLQSSEVSEGIINDNAGTCISIRKEKQAATVNQHTVASQLSGIFSVYTSKEYSFAATSTPKKIVKKDIPNLNTEEIDYIDKVADLIRAWMETLPKQYNDDKKFKEIVISDLAGDVMYEAKLRQLSPDVKSDSDKYLSYITHRWLYRFDFFEDLNEAKPMVSDFIKQLHNIPIPSLTRSQHGNRQAMKNLQHMQGEMRHEDFIPQGIDVLEDQISVWINEQPSQIYTKKDKNARSKQIHDLALALQDRLRSKSPDSDFDQDIKEFLDIVLNPKEKDHIGILTENLKEKIKNAPQDETLENKVQKMRRDRANYPQNPFDQGNQAGVAVESQANAQQDADKTMKDFISKFIEHNYDIDDPMARGAFGHLLKTELRKMSPLTRKEVYDNLSKSNPHEDFDPSKMCKELEYIKVISDWLKNIPIDASFNTVGNKHRVDFVNDLAKNILETEYQRLEDPSQMDYDVFIASIISQSIRTYELPILVEHKKNEKLMVDQLMNKIVSLRLNESLATDIKTDSSLKDESSSIQEQDISEFIEQYIHINGREIAEDEVKLEAWSARLLKEVKKMIHENEDPNTLCKTQVYNRFIDVPIPGEESVKLFGLELEYVKEISDWLKNLPLLPIDNDLQTQKQRIEMISKLAERLVERTVKQIDDPNNTDIESSAVQYINEWISKLPLDSRQKIVLPIVTQQLLNRIDRVNKKDEPEDLTSSQTLHKSEEKNKQPKSFKERNPACCNTSKGQKHPGKVIVEAIENWSNKLPIQGDIKIVKAIKETITKKIYQKIGDLNADSRVFNDNFLYQEILEDEIDTQLEKVPQNVNLQNQKAKLIATLLDTILNAKNSAQSNAAGEHYKHKLETTIHASIPNPIPNRLGSDPGFEIYKNHLADMFILQNFDHANDGKKIRYEKIIKDEIDKYSENALSQNATTLTKDQMYNELYSALFKVPMPCGKAVIDEVEKVKTRCEIHAWFDELPIRQASSEAESLERDKIIKTLAKRIHDIEKESKPDEKIQKEAMKWINKLPLFCDQEGNNQLARKLLDALNSTAAVRKCVTAEPKVRDTSKIEEKSNTRLGTSQIAGSKSTGHNWASPPPPCCAEGNPSCNIQQKPANLIIEVAENWSKQIPLVLNTEDNKVTLDNLTTNIIMKISELNSNPEIFENDVMFYELLDEELDKLLQDLPTSPDFKDSIPARKYQLIEMIKSIKPLMKEEKAKHEYKEDLKNTVNCILIEPQNTSEDKLTLFNDLKNDVVESFVQYNYNKDDDEEREVYKRQVHDAVIKYFINLSGAGTSQQDPLIVRNQLLCELGKIPIPSVAAVKDTVEEIKMKKEVEGFFKDLPTAKGDTQKKDSLRKQLIVSLSKRLNDLEKSGHSLCIEQKMKSEISRCLKKLDVQSNPDAIDAFVDNLKRNEASRKTPLSPTVIGTPVDRRIGQLNYENFHDGVATSSSICPQNIRGQNHYNSGVDASYQEYDASAQQSMPSLAGPRNSVCGSRPYKNQLDHESFRNGVLLNSSMNPIENHPDFRHYTPQSPFQQSCSNSNQRTHSPGQRSGPNRIGLESNYKSPCQVSHACRQEPYSDQNPNNTLQRSSTGAYSNKYNLPANRHSGVNPGRSTKFFKTYDNRPSIDEDSSPSRKIDISLDPSDINYDDFSGRVIFKSSIGPDNRLSDSASPNVDQGRACCSVQTPQSAEETPSSLFIGPRASQIQTFPPLRMPFSSENGQAKQTIRRPANFDGVCSCVKRVLNNCKGKPHCKIKMEEYCDQCGGFGPMWWRIYPGLIFY